MTNHRFNRWSGSAVVAMAIFFAMAARVGLAEQSESALKQLETILQKAAATEKPDAGRIAGRDTRPNAAALAVIQLRALERAGTRDLDGILDQIALAFPSSEVRLAIERFRVERKTEQEAAEQAFSDKVQKALDDSKATVRSAHTPADLDALIVRLAQLKQPGRNLTTESSRARFNQLEKMYAFVVGWQDYLQNLAAGDEHAASSKLRSLSQSDFEIFPRSEMLAKLSAAEASSLVDPREKIRAIIAKTKTPQDIRVALNEVDGLLPIFKERHGVENQEIASFRGQLERMQFVYERFQSGLAAEFQPGFTANPGAVETTGLDQVRTALLRMVAPRVLEVEDTVPLEKDETLDAYLDRVWTRAEQGFDVKLMMRINALRNSLKSGAESGALTQALSVLLAGSNQEEANQFMLAVASYQSVLKIGTPDIPAKMIGQHLDAIKTAHPEEYAQGVQYAERQPSPFGGAAYYSNRMALPVTMPARHSVVGNP